MDQLPNTMSEIADQIEFFQTSGLAVVGFVFYFAWRIPILIEKLKNFDLMPFNKSLGITASLLCTINAAICFALAAALFEMIVSGLSIFPATAIYANAYQPITILLSLITAIMLLASFTIVVRNQFIKEYKQSLWHRISALRTAYGDRGVSTFEIALIPLFVTGLILGPSILRLAS